MSKKGLIASLIVGIAVTLTLGIYTIVSCVTMGSHKPTTPGNTTMNVAFRTGDETDIFAGYDKNKITFTLNGNTTVNPLVYDEENNTYVATTAGSVTAVVKKGKSKITYVIDVYLQGDGSLETTPFIIANEKHLLEYADMVNTLSADREVPMYTKLVADLDLSAYNWKPIGGQGDTSYGNRDVPAYFDGNNKTIKNLTINVNETNYKDFMVLCSYEDYNGDNVTGGFIDLGLFGRLYNARVSNLNMSNSNITVTPDVYEIAADRPDSEIYDIIRITIGTIAGTAYDSEIVGSIENKNVIDTTINGFSWILNYDQPFLEAVGGMVGVGQQVRVNNYKVAVNVTNNQSKIKGSIIGGVVGYMTSEYVVLDTQRNPEDKCVIDNVEVEFSAALVYNNAAQVGGIVGVAENIRLSNSNVASFKITDTTRVNGIDFSLSQSKITKVAGIAYSFRSLPLKQNGYGNGFEAEASAVVVNNADVYMLGGIVSGAFYRLGRGYTSGVTEDMTVTDIVVNGTLVGNHVSGFAFNINPNVKVNYTQTAEYAVNVTLKGYMTAGFAYYNYGVVNGYENGTSRTKIAVTTIGFGAEFRDTNAEYLYNVRNNSFAVGVVVNNVTKVAGYNASIAKFNVQFTASKSVNYAGVSKDNYATLKDMNIEANVTSFNYNNGTKNFSTTYMISGVTLFAQPGSVIDNIKVVINANKDVDKNLAYGTSFFGGIVARYTGDSGNKGITINNCTVSGDVYFNYSYEKLTSGSKEYVVFIAGGLIGSMQSMEGSVEYVDALGQVNSIVNTVITNNTVSNLKITADFVGERMGDAGWRTKGIGSMIGVLYNNLSNSNVLNLSTNSASGVEIVADQTTFSLTKSYGTGTLELCTLGAGKTKCYGTTASSTINVTYNVVDPTVNQVTYTKLPTKQQ